MLKFLNCLRLFCDHVCVSRLTAFSNAHLTQVCWVFLCMQSAPNIMPNTDARGQVDAIRVVSVNKGGIDAASASIGDKLADLRPGAFVAIDTEFSGLGQDKDVSHDNLQVRYSAIRRLANTRGIYSVGISIFNPRQPVEGSHSDDNGMSEGTGAVLSKPVYDVATYDLLTSCQSTYEVSSNSGEFLVTHGFDFNRMFREGIHYVRASTAPVETTAPPNAESVAAPQLTSPERLPWQWGKLPRGLLWRIGHHNVPIIVHNGLFDLIFMFAAFQAPLPESLNQFVSVLLDCVPAGFWDTKVVATSTFQRNSFLAYLFAKSVLASSIQVYSAKNLPAASTTTPTEPVYLKAPDVLCALFSFKGFCPRGTACPFCHDAFRVVEEEQKGLSAKDSNEAYKRHRAQSKSWKKLKDGAKSSLSKKSKKQRKKLQDAVIASTRASDTTEADAKSTEISVADAEVVPTKAKVAATNLKAIGADLSAIGESPTNSHDIASGVSAMETVTAVNDNIVENVCKENAFESIDGNGSNEMELVDKAKDHVATEDAGNPGDSFDSSTRTAHSAGWDAFCTGYIFGAYRATMSAESLEKHHNYIALSKKLSDLLLRRSEYADLDDTGAQQATATISELEESKTLGVSQQ